MSFHLADYVVDFLKEIYIFVRSAQMRLIETNIPSLLIIQIKVLLYAVDEESTLLNRVANAVPCEKYHLM